MQIIKPDVFRILFLLLVAIGLGLNSYAQVEVIRSGNVTTIGNKQYYVHLVEEGQTLYAISKAYSISVDEIIYENPEVKDGLKAYETIRIPVVSRDVTLEKAIVDGKADYIYHVTAKGQDLQGIARIYEVGIEDLRKANPSLTGNPREGQYIKIPMGAVGPAGKQPEVKYYRHLVTHGETYFSLSKKYGITIDQIKRVNQGLDYPRAGMEILIPLSEDEVTEILAARPQIAIHVVRQGETVYSIARDHGVGAGRILDANPGAAGVIYPGMELKIPMEDASSDYITHRVDDKRSTLKKVAALYDVAPEEVEKLNPQIAGKLYQNQQVKVPSNLVEDVALIEKEVEAPALEEAVETQATPSRCTPSARNLEKTYRIALMIPLSLEKLNDIRHTKDRTPEEILAESPFRFLPFYQGLLLAADSLKKRGLKLEIVVYDVDQEMSKTVKATQDPGLKETDLIIGPFFKNNFTYVANFAKMFGIPVVNPLSPRPEILTDNPFVIKVVPSREGQYERLIDLVREKFKEDKIFVVRANKYQDEEATRAIIAGLDTVIENQVHLSNRKVLQSVEGLRLPDEDERDPDKKKEFGKVKRGEEYRIEKQWLTKEYLESQPYGQTTLDNMVTVIDYAADSIDGFTKVASIARNNLVIVYSENEALPLAILSRLSERRHIYPVTVIGLPEWDKFEHIEYEYLMNLGTYVFSQNFVDFEDPRVMALITAYRQRYQAEPLEFGMLGFDVGWYFFNALAGFGDQFTGCLENYRTNLNQSGFFFGQKEGSGFENQYWNVYQFNNYKTIPWRR